MTAEEQKEELAEQVIELKSKMGTACAGSRINVVASACINILVDCYSMETKIGKQAIIQAITELAKLSEAGALELLPEMLHAMQREAEVDLASQQSENAVKH